MRWINLEPIIQSEVSQKEKNRYHILTFVGNLEGCFDESNHRAAMETQT